MVTQSSGYILKVEPRWFADRKYSVGWVLRITTYVLAKQLLKKRVAIHWNEEDYRGIKSDWGMGQEFGIKHKIKKPIRL